MSLIKGELDQMRTLGRNLERQGDTVDGLLKDLRTQLGSTEWEGRAATEFRSAWQSEFEPALMRMSEALHAGGREVDNRARAMAHSQGEAY